MLKHKFNKPMKYTLWLTDQDDTLSRVQLNVALVIAAQVARDYDERITLSQDQIRSKYATYFKEALDKKTVPKVLKELEAMGYLLIDRSTIPHTYYLDYSNIDLNFDFDENYEIFWNE